MPSQAGSVQPSSFADFRYSPRPLLGMAKRLLPLLDRVLVEKVSPPAKSIGGVLLPDAAGKVPARPLQPVPGGEQAVPRRHGCR